jgi:TonB family protein
MQTMRILITLATLAILGACASTGGGRAPQMPEIETALPVAAFIDSAALHQALLGAPPVPATLTRRALFRVVYDSTGALREVEPLSRTGIPEEWGATVAGLLRRHATPRIATGKSSSQLVGLVTGASPAISVVETVVEAKPVLLNGPFVARQLSEVARRLAGTYGAGREFHAVVSMRVDEAGVPVEPVIYRSTGQPPVDREILAVAGRMRFRPAQISGYPVTTLVSLPINMIIPEPSLPSSPRQ